jgi:hypothetical protein
VAVALLGSGGTERASVSDGCAECPTLQRRCGARGAQVASSMVDETLTLVADDAGLIDAPFLAQGSTFAGCPRAGAREPS